MCRSQWPRSLRRRSAAARLLKSWVRIPAGEWMFVCCECCVLSGRGFCDVLITRPEESYRLWCVVVCDLETSRMRMPRPTGGGGCRAKNKQILFWNYQNTIKAIRSSSHISVPCFFPIIIFLRQSIWRRVYCNMWASAQRDPVTMSNHSFTLSSVVMSTVRLEPLCRTTIVKLFISNYQRIRNF
jgi:hypothetical protein